MSTDTQVLEYRVTNLEKTQDKIVKTVESIDKKQHEQVLSFEVLRTRVGIYAAGLAIVISIATSVVSNYINRKVVNPVKYSQTIKAKSYVSAEILQLKAHIKLQDTRIEYLKDKK